MQKPKAVKDYYALLELKPLASIEEVKAAYRRLARQFHPDLNQGNKLAEERFKLINEAYALLGNPEKKEQFDQTLRFKTTPQSTSPKSKPTTAKSQKTPPKASQSTATAKNQSPKPSDTTASSKIPFQDIWDSFIPKAGSPKSESHKPEVKEQASSPRSKASEATQSASKDSTQTKTSQTAPNKTPSTEAPKGNPSAQSTSTQNPPNPDEPIFWKKPTVESKDSTGERFDQNTSGQRSTTGEPARRGDDVTVETLISGIEAEQGTIKTVNVQHKELCKRCAGTGRFNSRSCMGCNGDGAFSRLKKIDVRIPGGVRNGSKVRVASEGGRGSGGRENGDLFLLIKVSVDPSLRVEGLDVYCDFAISMPTAVLGAEVDVPTLAGLVKMTIPPLTSSGRVLRLKGLGAKSGNMQGDQFVTVMITAPENPSAKEIELYKTLAQLEGKKDGKTYS